MITKAQAKSIADAQHTGATVNSALLDEEAIGRQILDDANHAVLWAAKRGYYTTPVNIGLFTDLVIDQAITDILALGYTVDQTRRPGYKELFLGWS